MLLSGIRRAADSERAGEGAAVATGLLCHFKNPKYHPSMARTQTAAMPVPKSNLLLRRLEGTEGTVPVLAKESCNRCTTSAADCGRRDGSLARQAATASSQTCGTNAGSMLN